MRVVCVHPVRDPVSCAEGPVHIGSAPDDAIAFPGSGLDPRHLTLVADARGLVLSVRPGSRRVYVNARAVRERALLHYGDTITLGAHRFMLAADAMPPEADAADPAEAPPGQVTLRIMSGMASGQALEVAPELRLGAGTSCFADLGYGCRVVQAAGRLVFESDSTAPRVNGWRCSGARLLAGDQIVLGEHRLVVEAPGLQYAERVVPLPAPRPAATMPEPAVAPPTGIWWLIAAGAVLAAVIALFLYFGW